MHPKRTSKLVRRTRKAGEVRKKRSTAEEETSKEKASVASPPGAEAPLPTKNKEGVRHTRSRTPKGKSKELRRHKGRGV